MKPYTVALTIHIGEDGDLGLFTNGLKQNVLFLYDLFKQTPGCLRVVLLNQGPHVPIFPDWLTDRPEIVPVSGELVASLDFLIAIGQSVQPDLVAAVRARGGKVISYRGGNALVLNMEAVAGRPLPSPGSDCYFDHASFDAVWTTPQHMRTNRAWLETIYRCPVFEVPQVWSPRLLQASTLRFGYNPGDRPWRVAIMDPNSTVMKTSHIPMAVCELAYRARPKSIETVKVLCSEHLKTEPAFNSFASSLDIVKAGKMSFEGRWPVGPFLAEHADAVVTHQWENELNYLYYDVLWGGYPLIHNSEALRPFGYYYDSFEPADGARALEIARVCHDADGSARARRNAALFDRLSPYSGTLQHKHEELLAYAAAS